MDARTVATVAHGLATAQRASGWRGADALWDALAERAMSAVRTREFDPHSLVTMGQAYEKAGRTSPALSHAIASAMREFGFASKPTEPQKPPPILEGQLRTLRRQETRDVYPAQRAAAERVAARAARASAKATPMLLALLNSSTFRTTLRSRCAPLSTWPARRLLSAARANAEVAELTHQFGHVSGADSTVFPGMTTHYGLVTSHFVTTAQVRSARAISCRSRADLGPISGRSRGDTAGALHQGRGQQSVGGDVRSGHVRPPPAPQRRATNVGRRLGARALWCRAPAAAVRATPPANLGVSRRAGALNWLRADLGPPWYGVVTAVFSARYRHDGGYVAVLPADSGTYMIKCNRTFGHAHAESSLASKTKVWPPLEKEQLLRLSCLGDKGGGTVMTPGVAGHIDHVILHNHLMWAKAGTDTLAASFRQWCNRPARAHAETPRLTPRCHQAAPCVSHAELMKYPEVDLLHHVVNAPPGARGGITLLVGRAVDLLGTPRGESLRRWALERRIALAWAAGDGEPFDPFDHSSGTSRALPPYSFRRHARTHSSAGPGCMCACVCLCGGTLTDTAILL